MKNDRPSRETEPLSFFFIHGDDKHASTDDSAAPAAAGHGHVFFFIKEP
jgi:hypothetical protein